jgi:Phosphodiester glycosidase/S-layer homology domain
VLRSKKIIPAIAFSLMFLTLPQGPALADTTDEFNVSSGVKYKHNKEVINSYQQHVNLLEINLADPYTKMDLTYPSPLNALIPTSAQAKSNHYEGHRVVGAVNGSFFDPALRIPMYLISYNNKLVNYGLSEFEKDHYVDKPAAFGVTSSGKGLIDTYSLSLSMTHGGRTSAISSMNKTRLADELILYTPENLKPTTEANQYGIEVVFSNATKNRDLSFGDTITGTVSSIRPFNDPKVSAIPADGFVLSAHGNKMALLEGLSLGDQVQIDLSIDDKWKNAQFMLASGPMLVTGGRVSLTMDPNNVRSRERAPRTAIALDQTGTKATMVTVDGRISGYSKGMTLPEFAQYLQKLGVYNAINLDGGGSTTMAVRKQGTEYATAINRFSDAYERGVSTTLQAVSTASLGNPKYVNAALSHSGSVKQGTDITVSLKSVLDQFYNPLSIDPAKLNITSTIGEVQGLNVKASKPGQGTITVDYAGVKKQFSISVTSDAPSFSDVPSTYKYYKEISSLTSQSIINGYPDGTFRPNVSLTRMDAALLLARTLKLDTVNVPDVTFKDVPKTHKFYNEVAAIAGAGVMNGKAPGVFDPKSPLTRAEMAVILHRAFDLTGSQKVAFKDVTPDTFGYYSISTLLANGITEGFPDNTFRPKESVNRFQFVLFLYRIIE